MFSHLQGKSVWIQVFMPEVTFLFPKYSYLSIPCYLYVGFNSSFSSTIYKLQRRKKSQKSEVTELGNVDKRVKEEVRTVHVPCN